MGEVQDGVVGMEAIADLLGYSWWTWLLIQGTSSGVRGS